MDLPFKLVDYSNTMKPTNRSSIQDDEVDSFINELSRCMKEHGVEIICATNLVDQKESSCSNGISNPQSLFGREDFS